MFSGFPKARAKAKPNATANVLKMESGVQKIRKPLFAKIFGNLIFLDENQVFCDFQIFENEEKYFPDFPENPAGFFLTRGLFF